MSTELTAADRLIVALDVDTRAEALAIVDMLDGLVSFFKIGWRLFIREGFSLAKDLIGQDKRVFLDLKMDDIEETITTALANFPAEGIALLTLQGGAATARAAQRGRGNRPYPKLLNVTLLSSLDTHDLQENFNTKTFDADQYVLWKAQQALAAGIDGLIASGHSVKIIRENIPGDYLIVTPGIRPSGASKNDHKRILTPYDAIVAGSDYLVVGRPIRTAVDPRGVAENMITDIENGLRDRS